MTQTYQAYNEGTYALPGVSATVGASAGSGSKTKTSNATTTTQSKTMCQTCGFSAHEDPAVCKFWHEKGPKTNNIAWAESTGNQPFYTFAKKCLPYQKLGSDKQQQLQILVAKIITDKCWPMKGNSSIDPQFRSYLPGGNTGGSQTSNVTPSNLLPNSPTHHTIMADNRQPATMVSNGPKSSKSVIVEK